jgi:molecular chaperone GrpE
MGHESNLETGSGTTETKTGEENGDEKNLDADTVETVDEEKKPTQDLGEKLEKAEKEAEENYDRFLRATADLENYKKRTARELEDLRKYANEGLLRDLLTVVDNLERAILSADDSQSHIKGILEGVDMTLKEIIKILERSQVKVIQAVGKKFDPVYHQAFMTEESETHPANTVLKELQRGYTLYDRLLRPAMVVVSTAKSEASTDSPEQAAEEKEPQNNRR